MLSFASGNFSAAGEAFKLLLVFKYQIRSWQKTHVVNIDFKLLFKLRFVFGTIPALRSNGSILNRFTFS